MKNTDDIDIVFTVADMRKMLGDAFEKGKEWGEAYGGWFSPSVKKQKSEKKQAVNEVLFKHVAKRIPK